MGDWSSAWGTEYRYKSASASGIRTTWNGFPVPYNETSSAEEGRVRGGKTSNPLRGGWREPSDYVRASSTCYANPGSITARNKNDGRMAYEGSGASFSAYPPHDYQPNGNFGTFRPKGFDANGRFGGLSANEQARCDLEALAKLKEGKVNYGLFLLEARRSANETARLLRDVLLMYRKFRRGQLPSFGEKQLARQYLRYIYGLKPLASDLYHSFNQTGMKLQKDLIITAQSSVSGGDSGNRSLHGAQSNWSIAYRGKTKMYASVHSPGLNVVAQMGLTNPLEILWEFVPYSFVVDWVVPVGTMLSTLDATTGLLWKGGYRSCLARGKSVGSSGLPGFGYGDGWTEIGGSFPFAGYECSSYTRQRLGGFPLPVPYIKSPFSTTHVTNALALWRNTRR